MSFKGKYLSHSITFSCLLCLLHAATCVPSSRNTGARELAPRRSLDIDNDSLIARVKRQAPAGNGELPADAAGAGPEAGAEVEDAHHPDPSPRPTKVQKAYQYANQKSEQGQAQSQGTVASNNDEMSYNPDGSVQSHVLETGQTNRQQNSQFVRKESIVPVKGPIAASIILGKGKEGSGKFMDTAAMGELPALVPLAIIPSGGGAYHPHYRRNNNGNRRANDRSVSGADGEPDLPVVPPLV